MKTNKLIPTDYAKILENLDDDSNELNDSEKYKKYENQFHCKIYELYKDYEYKKEKIFRDIETYFSYNYNFKEDESET